MQPTSDLTRSLIERWHAQGVALNPGLDVNELQAFEHRIGLALPQDFRTYLRLMNGFADYDMDNEEVSFYSTGRMEELFERRFVGGRDVPFLELADYLISSIEFGLDLTPGGGYPVLVDDGMVRAPSFAAFLQLFLDFPLIAIHGR